MQNPELAHPHDLLVRRFLTEPEFMADLLRHYPQNPAEQRMVALLDLERLVCKDQTDGMMTKNQAKDCLSRTFK